MKVRFITNACCEYESGGFRVLCDPWLTEGAFEGAWYHFPELKARPEDFKPDALYISHLHPDNFDRAALKVFRKDIPVVVLDRGENYLAKMLGRAGFRNLVMLKDGEAANVGPFRLTMFGPFTTHPYDESSLGNIVDSSILVEADGQAVLNANDNTLDEKAAAQFEGVTVAQLNYNSAGPYPSCFKQYTEYAKRLAHHAVINRALDHLTKLVRIIKPKYFMPFAGQFVLGGRNWTKTAFSGAATQDVAAEHVEMEIPGQRALRLNEGQVIDLLTDEIKPLGYTPQTTVDLNSRAKSCRLEKYSFEDDDYPSLESIATLMARARSNLFKKQVELRCFPHCQVVIRVYESHFMFWMDSDDIQKVDAEELDAEIMMPTLLLELDERLLLRCLTRKAHWNNADVGCHISYTRIPDVHRPDVHTLLSFFHDSRGISKTVDEKVSVDSQVKGHRAA